MSKSSIPLGLDFCNQLFAIEAKLKEDTVEEYHAQRQIQNGNGRLKAITGADGIASCGNAQNRVQVCPKEIPLTRAIAELHRDTTVYRINK